MQLFKVHAHLCPMLNLLHALTAGCAFFLSFLVFSVRMDTNTVANRWLAAFLCLLGFFLIDDSLAVFGIYEEYPRLYGYPSLATFALAPALYLCVIHFVFVGKRFKVSELWHFALFGLFFLLSLPFLLSGDVIKTNELDKIGGPLELVDKVILAIILAQIITYWLLSLRILLKHRKNIEQITASPSDFNLDWLLWLLYGIGSMILIWLLDLWYYTLELNASPATPVYFVAIWWIGYFALQQKEMYPFSQAEVEAVGEIMTESNEQTAVTRRSMFSEESLELLKKRLLEKMETDKPYLDPGLNLPELARGMQLSVHEMSQLVNEGFAENFAQFINRYRVEESKRLLLSGKYEHLNMVGIAYEAGFNSKTVFNTVFKKITGVSPSTFRSNHSEE